MEKSNPEFHDGDLYPFIYDMNGMMIATGGRTAPQRFIVLPARTSRPGRAPVGSPRSKIGVPATSVMS